VDSKSPSRSLHCDFECTSGHPVQHWNNLALHRLKNVKKYNNYLYNIHLYAESLRTQYPALPSAKLQDIMYAGSLRTNKKLFVSQFVGFILRVYPLFCAETENKLSKIETWEEQCTQNLLVPGSASWIWVYSSDPCTRAICVHNYICQNYSAKEIVFMYGDTSRTQIYIVEVSVQCSAGTNPIEEQSEINKDVVYLWPYWETSGPSRRHTLHSFAHAADSSCSPPPWKLKQIRA